MIFRYLILGMLLAVNFVIALYVLLKDARHPTAQAFFIFVSGVALWGGSVLLLSATKLTSIVSTVLYGGHMMIVGLAILSRVFPSNQRIGKKFLVCLTPILIFFLVPRQFLIASVVIQDDGGLTPVLGPMFPFLTATVGAYILFSLWGFAKSYRRSAGLTRQQLLYFFTGISIFMVAMFLFDILLPILGIFHLNLVGPLFSIVFVGFTAYAIVRHQLMDIRVVVQRGVIYSLLFALIIGFYLAAIFVLEFFVQEASNMSVFFGAGLTAIVGIFGARPLEEYFRRVTDRIFFKGKYNYSQAMAELGAILNRNIEKREIVERAALKLMQIFRTGNAEIIFGKTVSGRAGLVVPIVLGDEFLGTIVLGEKLSGDSYSEEDSRLLKTFASQAAVALEKARLYGEVMDYSRKLEERVKGRTAELQRLQEEQRRMMIDLAHALQTPLTIAKGELDLLKKKTPKNNKLAAFEKSVDNISKLTYDLLKLARLEKTSQETPKEVVNLSRLVADLVEYFNVPAKHQGITVASKIQPGVSVRGNKSQLEELVTNLLSNAAKYTAPNKKKKITIGLRKIDGKKKAELIIEDTGIGISGDDLRYIFDPFYRSEDGDSTKIRGVGLGLAICKAIISKHGGTIVAESVLGKGTKFITTFPFV